MTPRTRILAMAAGGMAVLYAAWALIIDPLRTEPVAIRGKTSQAKLTLEAQKKWIAQKAAIEAAWEAHKAKVNAKDINELARTFGQDVSKLFEGAKIDPGRSGEQHQEKIEKVFIEISSTANFRCDQDKFAALLRELDAFPGYLRVNTMTVTSHFDEAKSDMDVAVKVSTMAYGGEPAPKGGR